MEMNKEDHRAVDVFHNKCQRKILHIQWQDHVSSEEVLQRADMKPMRKEVKQCRRKMIGYILREDQNSD